jgi:3-hydroxyacyl-CoA dehydrogenase
MTTGQIRVAVVGTGEIGRGWAALVASCGWPVSLYDNDSNRLDEAPTEIAARARALVDLHLADGEAVEHGIRRLEVGRSLLQAAKDAQWIIEATSEDLRNKQRLFEVLESVAPNARAVTSSSSGYSNQEIAAKVYRKDRCLNVHPLNPPELIPLVEIVPSPETDRVLLQVVRGWLRALGRIPIMLKKPVQGNVVGRIAAAVWREAIDLVQKGVIEADDLDRAVSLGPALGWAAAGPLLSYHLAAGERGVAAFFQHLIHTFESLWGDLADWTHLEPDDQQALIHAVERTYHGQLSRIRSARDRRLAAILRGLEEARQDGGRITAALDQSQIPTDELDGVEPDETMEE